MDFSQVSKDQAIRSAELFLEETNKLDDGAHTLLSISNMYLNCADRILVTDPNHATALVFIQENSEYKVALPATSSTTMHAEVKAIHLRVIDPYADDGVWAIVDEGCNSCCHTKNWHDNAAEKWDRLGFQSYAVNTVSTSFTGVGTSRSTGR